MQKFPEILAPAGDTSSFLAAIAAGANAVYVGIKQYSARMRADNFSVPALASLAELARRKDVRLYVALNSLLKPDEPPKVGELIKRLVKDVGPDGIIIQDLALPILAREAGYTGELHLSTLAALTHPKSLSLLPELGISRVVLPRELNVDEIRSMAEACPEQVGLEVFVHGSLCHMVSGRCWWSSFLGGKSSLRGRCVQPCRREYLRKNTKGNYFSCQDLSLDVLVKTLLTIPKVLSWKIEGRCKGPHYVHHVVKAYSSLRDNPGSPDIKRLAEELLTEALGRPRTHYHFLPQRPHNPVNPKIEAASGLPVGKLMRVAAGRGMFVSPRVPLLPGDLLRVGCEDEVGRMIIKISQHVPKGGRYNINFAREVRPKPGTSVYLIDRREPGLASILKEVEKELTAISISGKESMETIDPLSNIGSLKVNKRPARSAKPLYIDVWRRPPLEKISGPFGVWMSINRAHDLPLSRAAQAWWWLPPVIWPGEEGDFADLIDLISRRGGKTFVLGAPWQVALFTDLKKKNLTLIAGPTCNVANSYALHHLVKLGFQSAFVSPELSGEEILHLPEKSPLPLGIVLRGSWPCGISRVMCSELKTCEPLVSPKGETFFVSRYGQNYWLYPNWTMDLTHKTKELRSAGYTYLVSMREPIPKHITKVERTGIFNWENGLL